jgi:hypothetical protein
MKRPIRALLQAYMAASEGKNLFKVKLPSFGDNKISQFFIMAFGNEGIK